MVETKIVNVSPVIMVTLGVASKAIWLGNVLWFPRKVGMPVHKANQIPP